MLHEHDLKSDFSEAPPKVSELRRIIRVFASRWIVVFGFVVILILVITAVFAAQIAPYDPYKKDMRNALAQPSLSHPLGTDALGRDTLSRLIYGGRTALIVGLVATSIAGSIGVILGLLAGYFGRWVNALIMRFVDALMSFPLLVAAMVLAVLLGGGLHNIIIAVGFTLSAQYARVMNGMVLSVKQNDYVLSARSMGSTHIRIMLRHVLVNCFPPIIVLLTINMGGAIMIESALSYLGVGISPPTAAWGSMVTDGYRYLLTHPVLALVPGVTIMLVVYSFNMVGDGLRDALDPRLRGAL